MQLNAKSPSSILSTTQAHTHTKVLVVAQKKGDPKQGTSMECSKKTEGGSLTDPLGSLKD